MIDSHVQSNSAEGTVDGGGNFAAQNSEEILDQSIRDISFQLENSQVPALSNLPVPWSSKKLAEVIRTTEKLTGESRVRENRELLLDYDKSRQRIQALRGFFLAYAPFSGPAFTKELRNDVKKKLLHEASHLMGYDEEKAREFSLRVLSQLEGELLACEFPDAKMSTFGNRIFKPGFILNRTLGTGTFCDVMYPCDIFEQAQKGVQGLKNGPAEMKWVQPEPLHYKIESYSYDLRIVSSPDGSLIGYFTSTEQNATLSCKAFPLTGLTSPEDSANEINYSGKFRYREVLAAVKRCTEVPYKSFPDWFKDFGDTYYSVGQSGYSNGYDYKWFLSPALRWIARNPKIRNPENLEEITVNQTIGGSGRFASVGTSYQLAWNGKTPRVRFTPDTMSRAKYESYKRTKNFKYCIPS